MIDVHGVMLLSPWIYYLFSSMATLCALVCLYLMLSRLQRAEEYETA